MLTVHYSRTEAGWWRIIIEQPLPKSATSATTIPLVPMTEAQTLRMGRKKVERLLRGEKAEEVIHLPELARAAVDAFKLAQDAASSIPSLREHAVDALREMQLSFRDIESILHISHTTAYTSHSNKPNGKVKG